MSLVTTFSFGVTIGMVWGLADFYKKQKWFWFGLIFMAFIVITVVNPTLEALGSGFDFVSIAIIIISQQGARWGVYLGFKGKRE